MATSKTAGTAASSRTTGNATPAVQGRSINDVEAVPSEAVSTMGTAYPDSHNRPLLDRIAAEYREGSNQ